MSIITSSGFLNIANACRATSASMFFSVLGRKQTTLSQGELLDRIKKVIVMATDFVLFTGKVVLTSSTSTLLSHFYVDRCSRQVASKQPLYPIIPSLSLKLSICLGCGFSFSSPAHPSPSLLRSFTPGLKLKQVRCK